MKILLILIASVLFIATLVAAYLRYQLDNAADDRNLVASIDAEVRKVSNAMPPHGLVVGVYKNGQTLIKGYGSVGGANTSVPDESTVFQLASVSKLITSALLQILSDEGVVEMEASLGELIGDSVELSPDAALVTLHQLATHTSGFPRVPKVLSDKVISLAGKESLMVNPYNHLDVKDVLGYLKFSEGKKSPGKFVYSNYGMGLLGHVLALVTDKDLESLATEKLFNPLDMKTTAIELTQEMQEQLAQGHTVKGEPAQLWTFKSLGGAGGFNTTAADMMSFLRANVDDSAGLYPALSRMHKKQPGSSTGIGWMQPGFIERFLGNKSVVWHNGLVGGYASYVSVDVKAGTAVLILSNIAIDITMMGTMLTRIVRTQSLAVQ
ncbi:MAG: serine hydrolase [Granulosicoccus sp.]